MTIITENNTQTVVQLKNYWTVLSLRYSLKEVQNGGDISSIWYNLANLEEVQITPQGKLAFVDCQIRESQMEGKLDYRLLVGLRNDHEDENLILTMGLKSASAQSLVEPLCLLPKNTLVGSIVAFRHEVVRKTQIPSIHFKVELNGQFYLNAPLSSFTAWQQICFKRLDQLQKKISSEFPLNFTLELPDPDF